MRQLLQNETFATNYDSAGYKEYFLFFYFFIECARPVHFPLLSWSKSKRIAMHPLDTGRKLNVYKTFIEPSICLLSFLCRSSFRPVSKGIEKYRMSHYLMP